MTENARELRLLVFFRLTRSFTAGIIAIVFPYYVLTDFHYSAFTLGLLYASAAIATAGLALLFGYLADLRNRRATLLAAGALVPVSALLAFSSGKLSFLFAAAMLGGFSATGSRASGSVGGAAQPIQSAVIADLTSLGNRTFFFSLFTFLSGVVGAAGMLAAKVFSTRGAFLAATLIGAAGLIFILPMKLPERTREARPLQSFRVIGKFSLTGAVNGVSQGLIMPFLIPFFVIVYRVPRQHMAIYGFGGELLSSAAILISPAIERRLGFVKGIAVTRGAGALLLLLLPLTRNFPLAIIVYLLTPALRVVAVPAQQTALTAMVHDDETGRALGMNQVARLTASSGAIACTGYLFDISEIGAPFYAYAAVIGFSLVLYFRFFGARPELRPR